MVAFEAARDRCRENEISAVSCQHDKGKIFYKQTFTEMEKCLKKNFLFDVAKYVMESHKRGMIRLKVGSQHAQGLATQGIRIGDILGPCFFLRVIR